MAECDACGKPLPDTAYVCRDSERDLAAQLRDAAQLWLELETTITGQARMADPAPRPRGRTPASPIRPDSGRMRHYADQTEGWAVGLPVNLRAVDVRDTVRNTVTTWVRLIAEERGVIWPVGTTPTLLHWLAGQLGWARYQRWAGELWDELGYACTRIEPVIDRPRPRVDAGECGSATETGPCRQRLSSSPGAAIVHCPVCRATHSAVDRRETLLAEARKLMATPAEIAQWLTMLGMTTPGSTVRRWVARQQLVGSGGWYPFDRAVRLRTELWGRRGMCRSVA